MTALGIKNDDTVIVYGGPNAFRYRHPDYQTLMTTRLY